MFLIVGLGNPGQKYAGNRHNVGFMAVDRIAGAHAFGPERRRFQAGVREGVIETARGPVKTLLMKPDTFMNESGRAVGEAVQFFKLRPSQVLAIYDELDLAPGKFRVKTGGGAAGHNGVRSLIAAIGPDFRRARIGIGHPGDKTKVHGWVLSDFFKVEEAWVTTLCDAIAGSIDQAAEGFDDRFQTKVARLAPPPDPGLYRGEGSGEPATS